MATESTKTLETLKAEAFDLINELGILDRQMKATQQQLQSKNQEIINFNIQPLTPTTSETIESTPEVAVEDPLEATA